MTCHCKSSEEHAAREVKRILRSREQQQRTEIEKLKEEIAGLTPDNTEFTIVNVKDINSHLILKVRYASCEDCRFNSDKILVFESVQASDALKWRVIDPHFSDKVPASNQAPSPVARFPPTDRGWEHAVMFVEHVLPFRLR